MVALAAVITVGVAAAPFESAVPKRKGIGRYCLTSLIVPCARGPGGGRALPSFQRDSLCGACLSVQKESASVRASNWSLILVCIVGLFLANFER